MVHSIAHPDCIGSQLVRLLPDAALSGLSGAISISVLAKGALIAQTA